MPNHASSSERCASSDAMQKRNTVFSQNDRNYMALVVSEFEPKKDVEMEIAASSNERQCKLKESIESVPYLSAKKLTEDHCFSEELFKEKYTLPYLMKSASSVCANSSSERQCELGEKNRSAPCLSIVDLTGKTNFNEALQEDNGKEKKTKVGITQMFSCVVFNLYKLFHEELYPNKHNNFFFIEY